jgi:cytochrome b
VTKQTVLVWDPWVRILHWALMFAFVVAWQSPTRSDLIHEWSGYACLGIVAARLVWGFAAQGPTQFSAFIRSPGATWAYAKALLRGQAPRHLGHNPLGGYMIVAMLAAMLVVGVTGWMFTTDQFWGIAWVRTTHDVGTDVLLVLIGLHITANIVMSLLHRENLVAAMWHGRKRATLPDHT